MFFYILGIGLMLTIFFFTFGQFILPEPMENLVIFDKQMKYNHDSMFNQMFKDDVVFLVAFFIIQLIITIPLLGIFYAPIATIAIFLIFGTPVASYFIVKNNLEKREKG